MILGGWYIKRLGVMSDGEVLVAVEGRREDPGHGTPGRRPWHSTAIRQRVDARTLKTASGSVYILNGPMNMHASPMSVFPASMKDAFSDGFPDNWMTYLRPGADGCAPALSQPMCTNNNSLDNHIEGALQSGAISAAATHPTAAGPSVPTPAAGSVPATDCIDEPNTRTSAADDELNVSSPNLVKSSTFNVSMSLQQAREGPNISANSEANAGAKAGHRGKSKETPEREKQTSSQGNADVPEGDTGNGANVTQNCASEAERADSVVLAGSQADTHDDIEIVVTQESDMSDEVLDGTICPSAAGMETEEGGEHASPSSSQTSKNLRHTDAPAAANSTVQVPALKDAHVRSKMCARRAVSPAPKRADARKQVSVDADRALVAKRASSAGASASKMTSRGGAKTPRSVPIPSHTSKTNDEAGASSSIGASRRKAGASSSEAKARSKRSTPDATREASYHAPVRRLSSGRVTIKPLAFWANEVVARTSDGAFIADGQNLKMKQFSNVIDLTASFASKITAPSSSNSELRKVRGASSGDLLEPRSDSSHDEVRRARGSSSSQRPPLPSNDKISIQRRTSAHSATDASRASTDVLQAEYSASGSCHANLGEYVVLKDEKVYDIARALQLDPQEVVRLNSSRLRSIRVSSRLKEGTRLLVPMTALGICSPDVGAGTSGTANFERQNLGEDEVQRDAEAASLQPPRGKRRSADLSLSVGDEVRILSQHEECGKLGRVVDPACGRGWVRVEISGAFYHFRAKQLGPVAALPKGHNSRDGDLDHDAPADENGPEPSIPPGRSMRVRLPPDRFQVSPPKEKRARDKVATISSSMASGDEKPSAPIHARECESADDSNDLAIGTVVHVIKEDSRRGCVGEVQAISNGWIRVRMDDSSASFRRCDLCVVGNRTNIQERGKAPLAGREGTSVQSTELLGASEPLATGNHGKEWSKSNIDKLKAAHFRTAPDVDDFWGHVAKLVPGYNAEECSNQYYLMYPTPSRNKRKRAATPIQAGRASTEATSHPDLLPASPWRGESRRGDDGEDDEDDGGVLRNFSSIDRSQASLALLVDNRQYA